jgi:outer membrane protein TolC
MKHDWRFILCLALQLPILGSWLCAEPLPLKRAVELALSHSTMAAIAGADEQHALDSYLEARDSYLPQMTVGSGLGATWGYPLSLEGSAPSIVNVTAQSPLVNFALRDFVRAARTDWKASTVQSKDQRNQVIQDTVLSYAELCKWESLLSHLEEQQSETLHAEEMVKQRIQQGVDSELAGKQARLATAQVCLRMAQAHSAMDVLRERLSRLTGLPANSIEAVPETIPPLPEVKQEDDLPAQATKTNPAVEAAADRATALDFRAHGEHRLLWPTVDFAAQYALLATFNNYQSFFQAGSFQQHNATIGVVIRFPFLNFSQHEHAQAADADALRAHKQAEDAKSQVSEETLKLQRSVEQFAAAQDVSDLQYQIAQSTLEATRTRLDAGNANWHDAEDAREQADRLYYALQDANFDLQRSHIALLRATGDLQNWVQTAK